jgi:hypothetical protein
MDDDSNTNSLMISSFQHSAFPQLKAIRAISGRSAPIMAFTVGETSSFIPYCGPESMGGIGDINAKIDAEVARSTCLSSDEIGPKVHTYLAS